MKPSPRIWVAPNRNTVGLGAVLLGMWYAGLTQNNGAAYLLCFMLAGMALVSIIHAWANLRGLSVEAQPPRGTFAGEQIAVKVRVISELRRQHFGLSIAAAAGGIALEFPVVQPDVPAAGEMIAQRPSRGVFQHLPLRLESRYPLGFFTAHRSLALPAPHHVYPAPLGDLPLPLRIISTRAGSGGPRAEGDDFAGVRAWRAGESQRHIDWKAVARGQALVIKEWSGDAETTVSLEWDLLGSLGHEARLSQLARWIVLAENGGRSYALRLPGVDVAASRGEKHFHACLRQLAAFPTEVSA